MLEHEDIPLEIVGMEVNPVHCSETGLLFASFGPKFARPKSGMELDDAQYIVKEKKSTLC